MIRMIPKSALIFALSAITGLGLTPYVANSQNLSPQQAYEEAVAYCRSGQPGVDVKNCLRDAGAALQQAKRGGGRSANGNFEGNRRARCERLTGQQRDDCFSLMSEGDVSVQGSVEGGGILRERTVIVPAN